MRPDRTYALGYRHVDEDPNVAVLLSTMDATGGWEATRRLRSWERQHLRLRPGERLLDVGCGLSDAALALAPDLGPDGEIVGIDASAAMILEALERARAAPCRTRFVVGDALALDEPDASFDVVRCERTLQWVTDPEVAVAEMARVSRAGGRISLIDTDWSTLELDVGDEGVARRVRETVRVEGHRPSTVGRRLADLIRDGGWAPVAHTSATQTWDAWDPDASPAPTGCFSMASLADDLIDAGQLEAGEREGFVSRILAAARDGHFSMALTMFAVVGARSPTGL